jgi:hypothetical protein
MDWSSLLVGLVGVLVGGAISWVSAWQVTSRQWKREKRDEAMGNFLKVAADTHAWWMSSQDGYRKVDGVGQLAAAAFELDLYAPRNVIEAGAALMEAQELAQVEQDWNPLLQQPPEHDDRGQERKDAWTDFVGKHIGESSELLGRYIKVLRKTVGLPEDVSHLTTFFDSLPEEREDRASNGA